MASPDTSWDVEQYCDPHQPPEHWQLTRQFIEANKQNHSEARLVCLAQCFANMEFLGCTYPAETMQQVAAMSEGLTERFRQDRQSRAQRTFVGASRAAEAKVTRQPAKMARRN